jgi:hypothetical protein
MHGTNVKKKVNLSFDAQLSLACISKEYEIMELLYFTATYRFTCKKGYSNTGYLCNMHNLTV